MYIDKFTDAIKNCRFCFMCRHLSAVGNVRFTEEDTPRVRAAMIYGATLHPEELANPDFIDAIYRSDLSACCRFHCVSHFDENGLNLATRADIVEKDLAPEYVKDLAQKLQKGANWTATGSGEVLFFEDQDTAAVPAVAVAFEAIMKKAGISYQTATGGTIGKALNILGFRKEAAEVMKDFAEFLKDTKAKTIVVANPAIYDALVHDFAEAGIEVSVPVMHTSQYIKTLNLTFAKKADAVYYLESDYLKNYNDNCPAPRALLAAMGAEIVPFGTNNEESYTCGEGAILLPEIDASLVEKLAKYIAERADHPETDVLAVASPYTKFYLTKYTSLNVKTLEELVADCL